MAPCDVATAVRDAIVDSLCPKCQVTDDSDLRDDLGADSLDLADLAVEMEALFPGLEVEDSDMMQVRTVAEVIAFVEQKVRTT